MIGLLVALGLSLATALAVDRLEAWRGLTPPGFGRHGTEGTARRLGALGLLSGLFTIGVFLPLSQLGSHPEIDLDSLTVPDLFLLHGVIVAVTGGWFALGYLPCPRPFVELGSQLGLVALHPLREIGLGLLLGLVFWPVVLAVVVASALALMALGLGHLVPSEAPAIVPWMAALPAGVRLAVAGSAGLVEETFFRGLLQPRVGIALSSLLFVAAHASYDEPFMLVGITLLSLFFASLTWWRQSVLAAVAAHTLFDALQLLVLIPRVLDSGAPSFPLAWIW